MRNEVEKEKEAKAIIIPTIEPIFFAYSSKWYVDLEDEGLQTDYSDISDFNFNEIYENDLKLNICILTLSGKPLFYRFEKENIVSLLGVAYTLFVSLVENETHYINENQDSSYMFIQGSSQIFLFYSKYPFLYITVSLIPTNVEFKISIYQQIFMIKRVRDFVLSVTTQSVLQNAFVKYQNFNFNTLLAGSEKMFDFWLNKLDTDLCVNLNCVKYLKLPAIYRNAITKLISQNINLKSVIFTLLIYKSYLVTCIQQEPYLITSYDVHLIFNMLASNSSIKSSEITCTPICLPNFNSNSFLYGHISYLDPNKRYCLIFLTKHQNTYQKLVEPLTLIKKNLLDQGHINILNEWIYNEKRHVYLIRDLNLNTNNNTQNGSLLHFVYIVKPGNYVTSPVFPTKSQFLLTHKEEFSNEPETIVILTNDEKRHIFNSYLYLKFRMNPPNLNSEPDDVRDTLFESSDAVDSELVRVLSTSFQSESSKSSDLNSPLNTFMQSLSLTMSPSSPLTIKNARPQALSANYNLIESLTSTYNVPPCNLGFTYYTISSEHGIAVCWRDLKYELYAFFKPNTLTEMIETIKERILKWIHREYKTLFPINT